jgi:hypothetical protein
MGVGSETSLRPLYPWERAPVPIVEGAWWAAGSVRTDVKKIKFLAPSRFEPWTIHFYLVPRLRKSGLYFYCPHTPLHGVDRGSVSFFTGMLHRLISSVDGYLSDRCSSTFLFIVSAQGH